MVAVKQSAHETTVVRDLVSAIGIRAVHLYTTTKDASPSSLKSSISKVETLLTPYQEPIQTKWKEHADPLLSKLDATIAEKIVPQAKAMEDSVHGAVSKSEEYWKASIQLAQDKVSATEDYLERVTDQIIKPYQQKMMESTEQYADVAKQKTRETLNALIERADHAIDYVLPEVDEISETRSTQSSDQRPQTAAEETTRLKHKIADRLQQRVNKAHIDLVTSAKDTVGVDDAKIASLFDKASSFVPTPEDIDQVSDQIIKRLPPLVQPVARKGANLITSIMCAALAYLTTFLLVLRSYFLTTSPSVQPHTNDRDNETHAQEQTKNSGSRKTETASTSGNTDDSQATSRKKKSKSKKSETSTDSATGPKDEAVVA